MVGVRQIIGYRRLGGFLLSLVEAPVRIIHAVRKEACSILNYFSFVKILTSESTCPLILVPRDHLSTEMFVSTCVIKVVTSCVVRSLFPEASANDTRHFAVSL